MDPGYANVVSIPRSLSEPAEPAVRWFHPFLFIFWLQNMYGTEALDNMQQTVVDNGHTVSKWYPLFGRDP